ncbi:hypothetical protein K443DRAFT_228578 [Laccaria amethystina LaAM-08-1]|uniref:Uncharacterized protein n=1 Tax=Laccaria amethystina LaAM-08-1 TaxID=1095629 RepID=A0A0C9WM36_9AGAR|nr:hypothetical protein K443DRAFT_228578 [Laccaria amethystina LaAM-08-1]
MRNKQKGTARQLEGLPKVNEITEWSFAEARLCSCKPAKCSALSFCLVVEPQAMCNRQMVAGCLISSKIEWSVVETGRLIPVRNISDMVI